MNKKFISFTVIILIFLTSQASFAQYGQYQGQVTYVPAGTPISVSLNDTLGSEFTQVGERFTASLSGPIYAGSELIAGAGSQVEGTVIEVNPAGRAGKPASMNLRLTNIITPDGRRIPLSATIDQSTFNLEAEGGRTSHLVKSTAVGAGVGALSGLVGAAISGGKKGKAAAIGTGIGAGSGLVVGAFKKGNDLIVQRGSPVTFRLDQAIQATNAAPPVQRFGSEYGGAPVSPNPYAGGYQTAPGGFADPYSGGGYQQQQPVNPYLQH